MHISSLPSPYGIGTLGKEAYDFAKFLNSANQSLWQVLPLCPTNYGNSPYSSISVFAYNSYFIDLEFLVKDNLLKQKDLKDLKHKNKKAVNYSFLYNTRENILKKAYKNFKQNQNYKEFCKDNQFWLEDYSLFCEIKRQNKAFSWQYWNEDYRKRKFAIIEQFKKQNLKNIDFFKFTQYLFYCQWKNLKKYVNSLGIQIIGDMPIYPSYDSVDVWANPQIFNLDKNLYPNDVAGVPPDNFNINGQLWGNPLYNWHYLEQTNYYWWIERLKKSSDLFDIIRIDHFRGFESYYAVPYGDSNAKYGIWKKGPDLKFFNVVKKELPNIKIIAEDLGFITQEVRDLVNIAGYPNMKVLQFAFDGNIYNEHLPYNYPKNCIAYTGTHDNDTLKSWYKNLNEKTKQYIKQYLNVKYLFKPIQKLIESILNSNAETVIIPMQDYLKLGHNARMNTPSTIKNNWKWRMTKRQLSSKLAKEIKKLSYKYSRNKK